MTGDSKHTEGVQIVADFKDRAIPLTATPPQPDDCGSASRSLNEGIHPVADFSDPIQPLHRQAASASNSNERPDAIARAPREGPGLSSTSAARLENVQATPLMRPSATPGEQAPKPKRAFLFPGQGAQSVGMAKQLCATVPAAQRLFDEAAALLGYNLLDVCANGPADRLNSTVVSQPAIFVASLAALESVRASEPAVEADCTAAAGLSLGEYTALVFAGALSFADGLRVVQRRGEAMQAAADATPSAMVSVLGLDQAKVEELCVKASAKGLLKIANLLCPANIVVSGTKEACGELERLAPEAGAMKTIRLAVAGAFHTELMKPADAALAEALRSVKMQPPRIPVWSNVDARPHTDPEEIRGLLVRQVLQPVLWEQTMRNLLAAGIDQFYEIGPGRVLAGLLKRVQRQAKCTNIAA